MFIHAYFFQLVILTSNLGQTDLVSGLRSGFIGRSVHALLQISVCSGYDLCPDTQTAYYQLSLYERLSRLR